MVSCSLPLPGAGQASDTCYQHMMRPATPYVHVTSAAHPARKSKLASSQSLRVMNQRNASIIRWRWRRRLRPHVQFALLSHVLPKLAATELLYLYAVCSENFVAQRETDSGGICDSAAYENGRRAMHGTCIGPSRPSR